MEITIIVTVLFVLVGYDIFKQNKLKPVEIGLKKWMDKGN